MGERKPSQRTFKLVAILLAPAALALGLAMPLPAAEKAVDFNTDIKPILTQSCVKCHRQDQRNPRGPAGGFRLDDQTAALKGGKAGNDIVPGKAEDSLMFKLLNGPVKTGDHDISGMPKPMRGQEFKPLAREKIDLIKLWIDQGAKWPA
jgi:Planctomycete cytochrome C